MSTRLKRPMLVLGTTILVMQTLFMPIGMVYAENTIDTEEQVELPQITSYLEKEQKSDPRFFFTRYRMQATAEEPLQVTFFSDQEVSEVQVLVPEEAILLKDQLPTGISVEEGEQSRKWIVQSDRAQNTFVLPLVFEKAGNYEISVEETTAHLEIGELKETSEEVPVEEAESPDDDSTEQEVSKEENGIEKNQENDNLVSNVREPISEISQEQQTNEEKNEKESEVSEPTDFAGETAEVTTMAQFREAVEDSNIGIISVQANLTENTANVLTVDRPLLIQGNGYTLTFGINGLYFQLAEVTQASAFRIENATVTKVGVTPLINATVESSKNWTIELEDITEVNANTMRLAYLPEGRILFTGGVSNFTRTTSSQIFIEAKEILAINQADVTISRGNTTVFFSPDSVINPKIKLEQGATVTITTTAGVANTIDFRGDNPKIDIQSNAQLIVSTIGTTATPTDATNNSIALTGTSPKIFVNSEGDLMITSTLAKRGIHLGGSEAQIIVNDSNLSISAATQAAINIIGDNTKFSTENSTIQIATTTGATTNIVGAASEINIDSTNFISSSTTGQRINLIGDNPILSVNSTEMKLSATTGRGIYLQGDKPKLLLEDSKIVITDSGASQGIILQGEDALFSLSSKSELEIIGSGTGTLENIQIGNNNARPELIVKDGSKLSVTTTSGTGAASDTANNAIHLRGANPKATITGMSEVEVAISSNARRGIYLNGANADMTIEDSEFNVKTVSGQALNVTGDSPKVGIDKSSVEITTNAGVGMLLSGTRGNFQIETSEVTFRSSNGQRVNILGANPLVSIYNSHLMMYSTSGRGIYLQGEKPTVTLDNSHFLLRDTGSSQGMILQGEDALLSLKNYSEIEVIGEGTGTAENIQIGNNNARPKLEVKENSKISLSTTSGNSAASNTINNAIHLRGSNPVVNLEENTELNIDIKTGAKRGIFLNGDSASLNVSNADLNISSVSGSAVTLSGSNPILNLVDNGKMEVSTDSSSTIELLGDKPEFNVSGKQTNLIASSNANSSSVHHATLYMGLRTSGSSDAKLSFENGATVNIVAGNNAPAIGIYSERGVFSVTNESNIKVRNGVSNAALNGAAAPLRFISSGSYKFLIDNSTFEISKEGGNAPAVRMYGGDNEVIVQNGGKFNIYNPGNGNPNNGGSNLGNQGIHYPGGSGNSFVVKDAGSEVNVTANNGPGIDMNNGSGSVSATNHGYFNIVGRTSTAAGGVFNAGILQVEFNNPLFMDFRNNRPGGGNIFNVSNGSSLNAINSDLSVWKNGVNLTGEPDLDFRSIDYSFNGVNFNTLGETNDPDKLNTNVFGTTGLTAYSRLSSNNARWAIVDELRIPTNADKKIYGRVSLPVGLDDSRPAWDDEVEVTVEIEKISGEKNEYKANTVGHSDESPGISIYGEDPRGGLFEIELQEPIEAGAKVRVSHVKLTSGELTTGFEHQILTETVQVFPIVPPVPAQFSSSIIDKNSTMIRGRSERKDVEVTLTLNGSQVDTNDITVDQHGEFLIDLSDIPLKIDDTIQVFLRDSEGSAEDAGVINPPKTNNKRGNVNPSDEFRFHDVNFKPATKLTVSDFSSVAPVDPLNPIVEINPENKPTLPEEQGLLSIDFISRWDFGTQKISLKEQTYYAYPQRFLNEDGTVNEVDERPNYVQISDRRPEDERYGWQLAVTQNEQFKGKDNQVLAGAQLGFSNQQLVTAQSGEAPSLQAMNPITLIPGNKRTLLRAESSEGQGTWIYRFGNKEMARESISLNVPQGANPEATTYYTTLVWELSAVPGN